MIRRRLDFIILVPLVWILSIFISRNKKQTGDIHKILIIKLAAVGDTVLLIRVIKSLKETYPNLVIDWLVSPINNDIATTSTNINKFIRMEFNPWSVLSILKQIRNTEYDAVIDFEQWSRTTALLSYFSKSARIGGFYTPRQYRSDLYTFSFSKTFQTHEIDDFYGLANLILPVKPSHKLELELTRSGENEIEEILGDELKPNFKGIKILIQPGCGDDGLPREWPLEFYSELIHWLKERYPAKIFLSGGPEERHKTSKLGQLISHEVIDAGGVLSWQGTVSLVQRMDVVISGNTGIMHIAAAFHKHQIALHGPTNPTLWGPLNPNAVVINSSCEICPILKLGFEYHRQDQECMRRITVEEVKTVLENILKNLHSGWLE